MATKITREILESYVFYKYKSYLKLTGQQGTRSDYETLLIASKKEVRLRSIDRILSKNQQNQVARNLPLTTSTLKRGPLFVSDATLDDALLSLSFDGLKKESGPLTQGKSLYLPMLFHEGHQIRKEQRLLLEVYGLLLSRYQAQVPGSGIIWHGKECKATRVKLNPDQKKAEQVLLDLQEMIRTEEPPKLLLNQHCQICEFHQRCRNQAEQEDNISLLQGISAKEIKRYRRKGIFTVTQLAHTFRPRRQGKRAEPAKKSRSFALQALAIRDKNIYVLGTPEIPSSPVHIYLDIESNPEAGFVYLIGLIVVESGVEKNFSFWADRKEQEAEIFEQFVNEVTRYEDFLMFCYGDYERAFIKRMRSGAKRKNQ